MAARNLNNRLCRICQKRVLNHEKIITCNLCSIPNHTKCLPIYNQEDIDYASNPLNHWSCPSCLTDHFPFNTIEDERTFIEEATFATNCSYNIENMTNLVFDPFESVTNDNEGMMDDIDPEQTFYNASIGDNPQNCNYYYPDASHPEFQSIKNRTDIAMIHMNIRSMPTNFNSLQTQLNSSTIPYNIVCLTETWLKDSNADIFGMTGFAHEFLVRGEKAGGGTSIFISNKLSFKRRDDLNVIKDEYEMLWIEIDKNCINSKSNIILGTIYRTPGTDSA